MIMLLLGYSFGWNTDQMIITCWWGYLTTWEDCPTLNLKLSGEDWLLLNCIMIITLSWWSMVAMGEPDMFYERDEPEWEQREWAPLGRSFKSSEWWVFDEQFWNQIEEEAQSSESTSANLYPCSVLAHLIDLSGIRVLWFVLSGFSYFSISIN